MFYRTVNLHSACIVILQFLSLILHRVVTKISSYQVIRQVGRESSS